MAIDALIGALSPARPASGVARQAFIRQHPDVETRSELLRRAMSIIAGRADEQSRSHVADALVTAHSRLAGGQQP